MRARALGPTKPVGQLTTLQIDHAVRHKQSARDRRPRAVARYRG